MFLRVVNINDKKKFEFECDFCEKLFISYQRRPNQLTFCCQQCYFSSLKKGEKANQKFEKTCLKKYGVKNPKKSDIIKEKTRQTSLSRYGTNSPTQSKAVREKTKQTCLERYGVECPFQSKVIQEKSKLTCLEKYGTQFVQSSNDFINKVKQTCLEKYGVDCSLKFDKIQEKRKQNCLEKYGVDHHFKSNIFQEKKKQTCLERYGVENPFKSKEIMSKVDWKIVFQKCHETKKKNGTYGKSKIEDQFYEFLCEKFGKNDVERQVNVHEWNIDFYIKTIEIYIQFDGVYWHGLDKHIKIIKESSKLRDKVIYKTYLRDQKQNKWFYQNNKRFVRVTDIEFKNLRKTDEGIQQLYRSLLRFD